MCPVMPCLSSSTCQADAIFASALQRSDEPSAGQVRQAGAAAISAFGYAGLRPRDRDLLSARYLRDLCIDDIAADLNVSAGTIKSQLAAARAALRLNLESRNGSHRWRSGAPGITGISADGRHRLTLRCDGTAAVRVLTPQAGELHG
jgi:Sigma-70, region 4